MDRVLVVDDDPGWEKILTKTLKKAGYEVDSAGTLKDAIDRLKEATYQVVVSDIRLTEEADNDDGIKLLEWIRDEYPITKAIAISGRTVSGLDKESFKEAYDVLDYIGRLRFDHVKFVELVGEAAKQSRQAAQKV